jgi:uncharacterized membrane protein YtjA (UPF0391 family)
MLRLSLASLVCSLSSGVFGFGTGAAPSWLWAKGLFFLFLIVWLACLISGTVSRPTLCRQHASR